MGATVFPVRFISKDLPRKPFRHLVFMEGVIRINRIADFPELFLQPCPAHGKDPFPVILPVDAVIRKKEEFRGPQGQDAGEPPPEVNRKKVILPAFICVLPESRDIPVKLQVIPETRQLPWLPGPSVQRPVFIFTLKSPLMLS